MKQHLNVITDCSRRLGGDNVVYKIVQNDKTIELYEQLLQMKDKLIMELEKKVIDLSKAQIADAEIIETMEVHVA